MKKPRQEKVTLPDDAGPIEKLVWQAQSGSKTSKAYTLFKQHETILTQLAIYERASRSAAFFDPYVNQVSKVDARRYEAREATFHVISREIMTLHSEARSGDQIAFTHLLTTAELASTALESLVETHRDLATALAKQRAGWPVCVTPAKAHLRKIQRMLKTLQVGTAPCIGFTGKPQPYDA